MGICNCGTKIHKNPPENGCTSDPTAHNCKDIAEIPNDMPKCEICFSLPK